MADQPNENNTQNTPQNSNGPSSQPAGSSSQPPMPQSVVHPSPQTPGGEPKPKGRKVILLSILALIVLALVGFAITHFGKSNSSGQAKKDIPLLRVGYISGPLDSFYPGGYSNSTNFMEVNYQVFEGLVRYQDKTKISPALATGWSNPDNSTWVFNLRPNVKFHTGRTMTAADVKASLEVAMNNEDLKYYSSTIKSVEAEGDSKVKITTDGPDPILLNKLTYLFIYDTKSGKKDDPINGTGPYVVKSGTTPKEDNVDLTAFDDYYGGHVYTREVQMTWDKEQDKLVSDFNQDKLDFAGLFDQSAFSKLKNSQAHPIVPPGLSYIGINTLKTNSPLAKKEFRQGLQYLVDKPAVLKSEVADAQVADQLVPQEIPGYDPSIKAATHDVAKAKALFAQAGFTKPVTLNLLYNQASPDTISILKKNFADAGITLNAKEETDFDAFDTATTEAGPSLDLYLAGYQSDFLDGVDFFQLFQDYKGYNTTDLDKIIDQAGTTIEPGPRLNVLKQASKYVDDNALVVPLHTLKDHYALNKPYVVSADNPVTMTQAYFWKTYQK